MTSSVFRDAVFLAHRGFATLCVSYRVDHQRFAQPGGEGFHPASFKKQKVPPDSLISSRGGWFQNEIRPPAEGEITPSYDTHPRTKNNAYNVQIPNQGHKRKVPTTYGRCSY